MGVAMDAKDFMPDPAVLAGIRKDIEAYEAERVAASRKVKWRVPLFLALLVIAIYLIARFFNSFADPFEQWLSTPHVFLYVVGIGLAILLYFLATAPARKTQQSFRERVFPLIFGFVDAFRYSRGEPPESFERMPREMVGVFNRESFDDVVSGVYRGFPFEIFEASFVNKAGKTESVSFEGVGLWFQTDNPFPGLLVAGAKSGAVTGFFKKIFGGSLEPIESGVPELDNDYDFRTDNADAARPLVVGRLAQAVKWLRETWPEGQALVALKDNEGFVLLPLSKNFFELPGIGTPLDYGQHVQPIIADLVTLLETAALVRKVGG